ncbi:MFS transporter [Zobellella maritima]|uniref:MFS transporter n=1 Tax=Zobellella maritima TaxID=2059725 RepID=UPI000E307AFE|nr:MFS transporter [Zobellella maritima]
MGQPTDNLSPERVIRVFMGVALAIMLGALEITLLMPALSRLGTLFDAPHIAPLLVSSYLFAMTLSMPVYGQLSDRLGRRTCQSVAISLFTLGSLASGLVETLPALIVTRLLTGLGGGGLIALSFAVIADVIPPRYVGRYQGYISAIFAISSVSGPLLGALLIAWFDWQWLFLFKVPLGLLALALNHWALRGLGHGGVRGAIDITGMTLLLVAALGWAMATDARLLLPSLDAYRWPLLLLSTAVSLLLIWHQWRHPHPVLPLHFIRESLFRTAILLLALSEAMRLALLVYVPLALESTRGMNPDQTSWILLWFILSVTLGTFISGKRIAKQGYCQPFPRLGGVILALGGIGVLLNFSLLWAGYWLLPILIIGGIGIGFLIVSCSIAVQNALPPGQMGSGLALMNFIRSLGGTLGVALLGWQYQQQDSPGTDWMLPVFIMVASYGLFSLLFGLVMPDAPLATTAKHDNAQQ